MSDVHFQIQQHQLCFIGINCRKGIGNSAFYDFLTSEYFLYPWA